MKESSKNQKREVIEEIKENIKNSKSTVLVSYTGLSVTEITELRNKYTEVNSNYKV
ncbi:MAG: 50S ribosomal protein L10, partial [Peptoniphilaceae bacterium]|nr:50S ribosomal protein L10 [Peptoniphilaceae bacterium]